MNPELFGWVEAAVALLLVLSGIFTLAAAVGVVRFETFFQRMHPPALAFSLFAAAALLVKGTGDLENFEIPEQLNYLIGISQAVYVAGKALPREVAKRLNEEIRAIRDAEQRVLDTPADDAARRGFETARNAVASTLFDDFAERFCDQRLRGMAPGERLAPPSPPAS